MPRVFHRAVSIVGISLSALMFSAGSLAETGTDNPNVYHEPYSGISIKKPADWHFLTIQDFMREISRFKLSDEGVNKTLALSGKFPSVVVLKYDPSSYTADINPSVTVNFRPGTVAQDRTVIDTLDLMVPYMESEHKNFRLLQAPMEVDLAGRKAGYMRIQYDFELLNGVISPATTEGWVIADRSNQILITATYRQDESNGKAEEIHRIIGSFALTEGPSLQEIELMQGRSD